MKGFSAMAGLHSATGKRTRLENELADTNDRNKRRNNDSGREQAWHVADRVPALGIFWPFQIYREFGSGTGFGQMRIPGRKSSAAVAL